MLWRRRREQDLDDEIASHLSLAARDGRRPAEFGNVTLVREITREMWGWGSLERLLQDIRYGLRTMRRSPAFTAVAVLSLALGIGANTAIFSLIDTLMLRSLPVHQPEQLVELLTRFDAKSRFNAFSWPTYRHLRDGSRLLDGLAASSGDRFYTHAEGIDAERVEGQYISGNYFPLLGIRPAIGRLIDPEDDRTGQPAPVAVVSWNYWQSRYHGDPGILGKRILLEDTPATIVGVTPPGFYGLQTGLPVDISIPLALDRRNLLNNNGAKWLRLIGRRKPGVPIEQVRAEMAVLFRWTLNEEAKINDAHKEPHWTLDVEPAGAGLARLRDQFSNPLLVLMTIVGMLLLIACANVASLLLARASARQREMAIRAALGAGRIRILRQVVTESLLLSTIAAALGLLIAAAGSNALVGIMKSGRMPIELDVHPDLRVLAFTAAIAMFTGLLFGLAPALQSAVLRRNTETRGRRLFGRALVVSQVALSVILLSGAGLFVRNSRRSSGWTSASAATMFCWSRSILRTAATRPSSWRAATRPFWNASNRSPASAPPAFPGSPQSPAAAPCGPRRPTPMSAARCTSTGWPRAFSRRSGYRSSQAAISLFRSVPMGRTPQSSIRGWRAVTSAMRVPWGSASRSERRSARSSE
jgi:predicted permease